MNEPTREVYQRPSFIADRGDAGRRLDHVICRHLSTGDRGSRTRVQACIADGFVRVNGRLVQRSSARTAAGDIVSIEHRPERSRHAVQPEDTPLEILYEDAFLVAVNKPAGIVAHPAYRQSAGTILNALAGLARNWPPPARPSLVGRLDKLTSGVMIAAKSREVHSALQRTLSSAGSAKEYLAVVYGKVNRAQGRITLRLSSDPRDRRRRIASPSVGADSTTCFERVATIAAPRAGLALIRCRLVTGRMHQIRVHLAARGWPIVGDPVYGEPRWRDVLDPALAMQLSAFPRQALHAWRTAFTHPISGERLTIAAPIPDELAELVKLFEPGNSRSTVWSDLGA